MVLLDEKCWARKNLQKAHKNFSPSLVGAEISQRKRKLVFLNISTKPKKMCIHALHAANLCNGFLKTNFPGIIVN